MLYSRVTTRAVPRLSVSEVDATLQKWMRLVTKVDETGVGSVTGGIEPFHHHPIPVQRSILIGQFAGFCPVPLITIVPKYAVWYYLYLYSMTHQPAKGLLFFLLPHFAVSMCVAAVCTQEMPHAERTARPPPQPGGDATLCTVHEPCCESSRTIQSGGGMWKGLRRGTNPCHSDG